MPSVIDSKAFKFIIPVLLAEAHDNLLVCWNAQRQLSLYRLDDGELIWTVDGRIGGCEAIIWHPAGLYVATVGEGVVSLIAVEEHGRIIWQHPMSGMPRWVRLEEDCHGLLRPPKHVHLVEGGVLTIPSPLANLDLWRGLAQSNNGQLYYANCPDLPHAMAQANELASQAQLQCDLRDKIREFNRLLPPSPLTHSIPTSLRPSLQSLLSAVSSLPGPQIRLRLELMSAIELALDAISLIQEEGKEARGWRRLLSLHLPEVEEESITPTPLTINLTEAESSSSLEGQAASLFQLNWKHFPDYSLLIK